jgi:hypothetical protein
MEGHRLRGRQHQDHALDLEEQGRRAEKRATARNPDDEPVGDGT